VTRIFPVDDPSRVAEIRRAATAIAREEGLHETLVGHVALVATEVCTNLLKHATNGEVFLSALSDRSEPGIEILAVDRGPGMTDVARCLADGYSSAKTSGTGLGAIARLSQEFDIYSEQGRGTVLVARIHGPKVARTRIGAVLKPITGEEVCGDAWAFSKRQDGLNLIVADGLGHGPLAARASAEAIAAFRRSGEMAPTAVLQEVHRALRGTRGAAVAVASVDQAGSKVRYAGIGNIGGVLAGVGKPLLMISHNGTAGYHSPRLQEFSYPLPEEALIVLHSDGLHTSWNLDGYPGLRRCDPSLIAGVLYRDFTRHRDSTSNRDDVCVVVAKTGGAS
jgi:anti-sigma regulatory factor (Ser/Thr protein kinase)